MERLPSPISIAVLLVAATGLRISEFLALRWRHVLWDERKIFIEQVFRRGTVSQTMLRHAKPDITAPIYTHGNFGKALDAQKIYMEQLLRMKPTSESNQ